MTSTASSHTAADAMGVVLAGLVLVGGVIPAQSQDIADDAARQGEQIERLRSEQQRILRAEQLRRVTQPPRGEPAVAPKTGSSSPGETCIAVKTISVVGATIVSDAAVSDVLQSWKGRCLTLTDLNGVLEAITFLYVDRGYVASRAYLPEQDLADGTLDIMVVEGTLESVTLNGEQGPNRQTSSAFPGLLGKAVNLRDVEQGLDQLNRLRSNKATIALGAGLAPGGSVLSVTVEKSRPWHASVSSDNLGGVSSGIYQTRADVGFDDILSANDEWLFSYQRSMGRHPMFLSDERPNSNTFTGAFSIPYGHWTFDLNGSWSNYRSAIAGPVSSINTSGGSRTLAPSVTRIFHRDQTSKTWVTGRLTWKETENFVLGSKIDVSSRVLSVATLEMGHSRQFLGGQATASIAFHRGLNSFGAFNDSTAPAGSPKAQFDKLSASIGYSRAHDIGEALLIVSTNIAGQWADDDLFGSEQMSLGGYSSVRGVREAVLYADTAVVMRNELSILLPELKHAAAADIIGRLEPYLAIDLGHSVSDTSGNSLGGNLIGAAVGLRNRGGKVAFDVSYADILSMPDLPTNATPPSGLVQARVSVPF